MLALRVRPGAAVAARTSNACRCGSLRAAALPLMRNIAPQLRVARLSTLARGRGAAGAGAARRSRGAARAARRGGSGRSAELLKAMSDETTQVAVRTRRQAMYVRLEDLDVYMRGKVGAQVWYLIGGSVLTVAGLGVLAVYYNWSAIRRDLGSEAATLAHDVLADDQLRGQLEQLSKMLVAALLADEVTVTTMSRFVQQILKSEDITNSVLAIVLRVIHDERTVQQVVELLQRVLAQPSTKDALVLVLSNAMADGLGKEASIEYVRAVVTADTTKQLLSQLATQQVGMVLSAEDTKEVAREFVETVLTDEALQARAAEVVWRIIKQTFTPWAGGGKAAKQPPDGGAGLDAPEEPEQADGGKAGGGGGQGDVGAVAAVPSLAGA